MTFSGFPKTTAFFDELAANNSREWFQANKARFESEWQKPMAALLEELRGALDDDYPDLDLAEPKIFRLNRDVQFSKNKDPYKTNIGGFLPVARGGAPSPSRPAALYIQYGAGEEGELGRNFVAAGIYGLEPAALTRFRAAIADARGDEFEALVRPLLAAGWTIGAMDRLKKVPKDYPADHPRGDWLKLKGFVLAPPAPLVGAPDAGLLGRLTAVGRAVAPVVRWLTFATA